jgi:N-acetylmuramoyl-L-alanine amidase
MQSQDLARRIQFQYRERVGREDRKVKEGPFLVLWAAGMPAVLTEIGFISNPSEARFLTSEQGRDYIASAIFRAVRDYKVAFEAGLDVAAR